MAMDLKLIIGIVIVTIAFLYAPVIDQTIIRSALGLAMALFIPGYAFIAALFPGKKDIDGFERAALSFGMSIAATPLIGLGLNFTPWGIRLDPIIVCLTIFTVACALTANKRRHDLTQDERFSIDFIKLYGHIKTKAFGGNASRREKNLTAVLIICILLSVALAAYVIVVPRQGENFTEFYILGPDGMMDNYPTNFYLGDQKPIIVDVVNHEYRNVDYDLVITLNNSINVTQLYSQQFTLGDNQSWEKTIGLQPDQLGNNMEMEFLLYANGNINTPYRELHLFVNVTTPRG